MVFSPKVHLLDNSFVFHKFDQYATVKTLIDILIANQGLPPKNTRNFGLYQMPVHGAHGMNFDAPESALDPARTLWSYDTVFHQSNLNSFVHLFNLFIFKFIKKVLELRFREHLHPITVFFFERTQDTVSIDFSKPVGDILPTILARFRIVLPPGIPQDPAPISLRKLGGSELDRNRSLRQHVRILFSFHPLFLYFLLFCLFSFYCYCFYLVVVC